MGLGDYVAVATANVEIQREPFAISPRVNIAWSCSEGVRQPLREKARGCMRQGG